MYSDEGFNSDQMIDSNLLIKSYGPNERGCTLLLECAWYGELDTFSYRDQPGFPYVSEKLGLWPFLELHMPELKFNLTRHAGPGDATKMVVT